MIRTIQTAERGLYAIGYKSPLTIPAATPTMIFDNMDVQPKMEEIAYRLIQNLGADNLYIIIGANNPDSTTNYQFILPQYAQLDVSQHRLEVYGYSAAGTGVGILCLGRRDQGAFNSQAGLP